MNPLVPGEQALITQRILDGLYKSAQKSAEVKVWGRGGSQEQGVGRKKRGVGPGMVSRRAGFWQEAGAFGWRRGRRKEKPGAREKR